MKWRVIAVGKPALGYARSGVDEYLGRLKRYVRLEMVYLKDGGAGRILGASDGCLRVLLDEQGICLSTEEICERVVAWEGRAIKEVALIVGGADGHEDAVRAAADECWAFGKVTLQHELALVVLLEQIYRVYTIKLGAPYHRSVGHGGR
ncbi:MAG: 23S rRNA (pseudouridine(1915)-N(3))-methyltransferase RlmH [Verrucomicrobiota bacterium]